jgi:hypothetical protein
MLPADFDPYFAVMGVKRKDWGKPVTPQPSRVRAHLEAAC